MRRGASRRKPPSGGRTEIREGERRLMWRNDRVPALTNTFTPNRLPQQQGAGALEAASDGPAAMWPPVIVVKNVAVDSLKECRGSGAPQGPQKERELRAKRPLNIRCFIGEAFIGTSAVVTPPSSWKALCIVKYYAISCQGAGALSGPASAAAPGQIPPRPVRSSQR
jgi:hypothetical protein